MIQPEELYHTLHRQPFQPFRVHLKDGRYYDIRYQHLAVVGDTFFDVGIPLPNQATPLCDHVETMDLEDITHVESLSVAAAS